MAYSNKALPPGTVLREWRLEQVLGVGGFGIVYRGRGIYFDELVAIKEYFPSAISERIEGDTVVPTNSDAEEVHALGLKKFVEEAKLLWNLSKPTRHPNIVSVRSLFEIHGTAYMVMDFEDGVSLSDILKSGKRFTEGSLMALIRPISEGLERAHRVGVLHRDIKPPNILVSEDGRPVLIDFGSARFDAGQATNTKVTFHTPPYAAIEQYVKTYEQGPWTDVYALGVVLYECVTGTKPAEVLERLHGGSDAPLADRQIEGFSPAFLRGIDAAMTIRPSDRPQTIAQWLEMFDPGYEPPAVNGATSGDEMATRFAAFSELPDEIVPVAPPPVADQAPAVEAADVAPPVSVAELSEDRPSEPPPAAASPTPAKTASASPDPARIKRSRLGAKAIAGAAAAAVLLAGGGYYLSTRGGDQSSAGSKWIPSLDASPGTDASVTATDIAPTASIADGLRALAQEAGAAGAPSVKTASAAADMAGTLNAETQADQLGKLARDSSSALVAALARDAAQRTARVARTAAWAQPGRSSPTASAQQRAMGSALHRANAEVAAAVARVRNAVDPAQAIVAARTAVAAYSHFGGVYARAYTMARAPRDTPADAVLVSDAPTTAVAGPTVDAPQASSGGPAAKVAEFNDVHNSAKAIANRVIAMGKQGKPGSADNAEVQRAYAVRQANAARAKQYADHLNLLARSIRGAKTDGAAQGIVAQAKTVRGYLNTLLADSTASLAAGR